VNPIWKLLRARLVQRIYFVGMLQFVIVAAAIVVLSRQPGPSLLADTVSYIDDTLSAESDSEESLKKAVERVATDLHWSLAVYDDRGGLVASAGPPIPLSGMSVPLSLHGRHAGHVVYMPSAPVPPGPGGLGFTAMLVLFVVGVSSWLTARSLAKPLGKLGAAATSFGSGDLSARVGLSRSDELGDVARAFDDMAERVTQSIRAERELLANVSHELRTPLQRIRIALDLAAEGDAATARESLGDITEDLVELERIVDDVLTATRLSLREGATAGAIPPIRREPADIVALLDKAAARFRGAHPERRLDVAVSESSAPTIEGDAVLLRRVVDNLLDNAHKYAEDPTKPIRLSCYAHDDRIVVEVADEGVGISKEDLARVFEPFFRVDRSRARATGGYGLGLVLSRRIIEAHGGTLTLTSEPGKGTTARIELPSFLSQDSR
jgi:signal transduction histidine kinase